MSEPELITPDEVAVIEQGFAGLVPLEGKGLDHENAWMLVPEFRTTKSGVSVNTRTALEISAVMSYVIVIAEDVGKMPFQLYRWDTKDKSGRTHRMRSFPEPLHPLAKLVGKPNPDMTGQAFRETLTLFALLTGTGYAWKARDGNGMVRELSPLVPGHCVARRDNGNWHDRYYDVWFEDGTHTRAEPSDIFRITGISWDGVCGLNRVTLAREVFGLSKRISEAQAKFYGKDQRPSGVISSATPLKPELVDRVRTTWARQFGPDGEGGVAVLDGGWKFEAMNVSAKDANSIALWRLLVEEACRVFRVQPLKVMHATGTQSYASVDILNQAHLTDTLDPWLVRWEQEGERDLLANDPELYWKFNRNAYLRPLPKDRWDIYTKGRQTNAITVNEIRDFEDGPLLDDPRADDPFAPIGTNPLPASRPPAEPKKPGEAEKPEPGTGKGWLDRFMRRSPQESH